MAIAYNLHFHPPTNPPSTPHPTTPLKSCPRILPVMDTRRPQQIAAEIEALRARIRRLRLERKVVALAESERKLLRLAQGAATTRLRRTAAKGGGKHDA